MDDNVLLKTHLLRCSMAMLTAATGAMNVPPTTKNRRQAYFPLGTSWLGTQFCEQSFGCFAYLLSLEIW